MLRGRGTIKGNSRVLGHHHVGKWYVHDRGDGCKQLKKPGSVVLTSLPLGDGSVSIMGSAVGSVYSCSAGNPSAGGSNVNVPWIQWHRLGFHRKVGSHRRALVADG
ncbi:hypothetical protein IWX88_001910 [Frigoribacterium sp. CG_9.8]|nr:hypothetical protein [Frigoribacterium sp. CG_9.8]